MRLAHLLVPFLLACSGATERDPIIDNDLCSGGSAGVPVVGAGGADVDGGSGGTDGDQAGAASIVGEAEGAGSAVEPDGCGLPAALVCNHEGPHLQPDPPPLLSGEGWYELGDRVWFSGSAFECYRVEGCTGTSVTNAAWKPLWWTGCEWASACELPEYRACLTYVGRDVVTLRDQRGKPRVYLCSDSHQELCNESSPADGVTYVPDGVSTYYVWAELDWLAHAPAGDACWYW
jgi:hypothetical protein